MRRFDSLRIIPWIPKFGWVSTALEAADQINSVHEDYPTRVERTLDVIESDIYYLSGSKSGVSFPSWNVQKVHRAIFDDTSHAGRFRDTDVVVGGLYRAPDPTRIADYMEELWFFTSLVMNDITALIDWYTDFETVHPFEDGNGRVGGAIVASVSHLIESDKGWLAPKQ